MNTEKKSGLLHRLYLYLKNKFDPTPEPKEEEIYAVQICQKLIMNPNSKLTNAPISFKRFIKNDDNNMFIVINNRTISLINHVYSYNVFIESFEPYSDICQLFDNEMEKRRQELEDEIKNNIQHSLKEILRKIS
jgi:hypothetical protein